MRRVAAHVQLYIYEYVYSKLALGGLGGGGTIGDAARDHPRTGGHPVPVISLLVGCNEEVQGWLGPPNIWGPGPNIRACMNAPFPPRDE